MFKPETYDPTISVENVVLSETSHGKVVAIVHTVIADEEYTTFFFPDTSIHNANGFHLQDENGKAALQAMVASIYGGWSYAEAIETLAANPRKTENPIHYCFSPIGFFEGLATEHCLGYHVYLQFIEKIYLEGLGETILMKEALQ